MHGRDGDYWKRSLHMCTRGTASVAGGFPTSNSYFKDGRKIRVGDCALFEPPQDSLPFIGIIRCLISDKESNLKFIVNWLYRASEVELEKGIQLDAAPNEIFYSFHEDEVPAASLLHPCKVAFLPKGVELPSGISSFICRRVYDINEKCLWWLTDQNYIDKRQEEVDHLLIKTRREMHATIQPGGRSPKTINDAAPASQVKAGSDGAQNVSSVSYHGKGKKRERSDQDFEPVKRLQKTDDGDTYQPKSESILKAEIAKITDRGGLMDYESVEKLVQLMVPGKADYKIDLTGRSVLAGVVAATDKFDCLSWFVQLKGLPVFDEWLQEIHKGKIGDGNIHKDGDKSVEEFLLVLLRALDKLPVNLRALQMCNIGKSVNHLRSHKNLEIQRKARGLVDTWKKRVEAEMNIDDGKPGSNMGVAWHGRRNSEGSQGSHRNSSSSENAVKSSSSQLSAPRMVLPKASQGAVNSKDAHPKTAAAGESPDHLLTTVKDEKSSSSSQSHSQSSSSDHIKTAESSGKEDPRSSTAGSTRAGEILRRTSRPRKLVSGLPGPVSRGAHRDGGSNRSPLHKPGVSEKISQSGSINEKMHDVPVAEGSSQKLIVKIPNRGRSPAMSANGGSVNEPCPSSSRATSPACPDRHEKPDCGSKEKCDISQINDASDVTTKSWHSSDLKDVLTGSDEADGTSAANHDEVRSTNGDLSRKLNELPNIASSPAAHETKPWKTHEPSFSPMNALVESCVKHSEANALISAVDDVGMNLLASVAAGEMSKCDSVATNSPGKTALAEDSGAGNSGRCVNVDDCTQELSHCTEKVKQDVEKQEESTSLATNGRDGMPSTVKKLATDLPNSDLPDKHDDGQLRDTRASSNEVSLELAPDSRGEIQRETNGAELEVLPTEGKHSEDNRKESALATQIDAIGANEKMQIPLGPGTHVESEKAITDVESPGERKIVKDSNSQSSMDQKQSKVETQGNKARSTDNYNMAGGLGSPTADYSRNYKEGRLQNKEVLGNCNGGSDLNKASVIKMAECPFTDAPRASPTAAMEKLGFDLNEGFTADEVKYEEQRSITAASSSAAVHVISPLPFPVSAVSNVVSNGLPASVTVAAAAKGAFVPPEDLLRTRGELGWKGSAATSAFRPAEPRKVPELQVNTSTPPSDAPSKSSRPFLNIDLNVTDDSMQDDMVSHSGTSDLPGKGNNSPVRGVGGLDLDLNQLDEATEVGQYPAVTNRKLEAPGLPSKPSSLPNGESSARRNFDLNNGPMLEEVGVDTSTLGQNVWSNMPPQAPVVSLRMNNAEMGNFASWFPQGNAISAVTIPAVLPDRGDQGFSIATTGTSQRIYYTPPGSTPFAPDVYRGPVLSSSPALSFPSAPYQYPVFPFGTSFPVPSATLSGSATYMDSSSGGRHNNLPAGHSQYLGHPGVVSSSYPRPYLVSIPDGRANGGLENSSRWGNHGLDLNSGPGIMDVEGRNDPSPFGLRQFSVASSQAFTEEQARMFQASGVVLKRKEPDGGWDAEKPKQPSWH
uniref:BAH domain-containing protein n=2 Tax=Kalanchoe fedtschenkoi TaxID=63787 RepID=A0A7N0SVN2_KALFE